MMTPEEDLTRFEAILDAVKKYNAFWEVPASLTKRLIVVGKSLEDSIAIFEEFIKNGFVKIGSDSWGEAPVVTDAPAIPAPKPTPAPVSYAPPMAPPKA